jgi:ubiquinone/menaquinone biosynthesis C-methylase UbiE
MLKTEWDYSQLAAHYDSRADYAADALDFLVHEMQLVPGDRVADVGAGTGKLALPLAIRGLRVSAVEPNDEMRTRGIRNTRGASVDWREGTGEETGLPDAAFKAVTFGSSFNVVNQQLALREARRIVAPRGWFCCLWNHRDLDDPLQQRIETIIREAIDDYSYGARREDPTSVLTASGLFERVQPFSGTLVAMMSREAVLEAWRSHGTLARQAGAAFGGIIDRIGAELKAGQIAVPYATRGWCARFRQ